MYKKFIINMIKNVITDEFGYRLRITKLDLEKEFNDDCEIWFSFESIFENVRVSGCIDSYGSHYFVEDENYKILKGFYKGM